MKRISGKWVLGLVGLLALVSLSLWWRKSRDARPHVLLISIDTCRADRMGFLGGSRFTIDGTSPTPHLDQLARGAAPSKEGLSPVPLTLPAHTSVFSGLYPDATGVRENDSFFVPPRDARGYSLLAEDLRASGYDTGAFVSGQPLERVFGLSSGFRVYQQPSAADDPSNELRFRERTAERTTEDAIAFLKEKREGPTFTFVHYFDPHHPYERWRDARGTPEGPAGDYLSEIQRVDEAIGQLLKALPDEGRSTLIIVFADHGESLGEHGEATHGFLLHESSLRVPLLIRPPEGVDFSKHSEVPGRLVDIYPTILDVCGVESIETPRRDGRSLRFGCPKAWTDAAETLYPYYQFQGARERAFRDQEWKLMESGSTRALYAWKSDPAEEHPVSDDDCSAAIEQGLKRFLSREKPGRAGSREVPPSAAVPYFGGRPFKLPIEPDEKRNRELPRIQTLLGVVADLDRSRQLIRDKRPAEALFVLSRHAAMLDSNPSLLFWTARAEDLCGRDSGLDLATRGKHLDRAQELYGTHAERWDDGKAADSLLRLHLERYRIHSNRAELELGLRLANGEINRGRGGDLTFALRGMILEGLGRIDEALADFEAASQVNPDDLRHQGHIRRLKERWAEGRR